MGLSATFRRVPKRVRSSISFGLKAVITVAGFYLLLTHRVDGGEGVGSIPIGQAILAYVDQVDSTTFLMWSAIAMGVKFIGVISSAWGWHALLRGQGLRFPFWTQVMTAFLIGRFIGTFLPSTMGLDGYTLYEAGRYSNQWHRALTAKALEKFIGIAGLFTGLLLTLPAGYLVLEQVAGSAALFGLSGATVLTLLIGGLSAGITGTVVVGLAWPWLIRLFMNLFGAFLPGPVRRHVERFRDAVTAYEGRFGLLLSVLLAKFITHFTTAVVYYFTALAIGVVGVEFLPIVFGSLIQILGTLFSPTIAGEGAREALQALLLSAHLGGAAQAVLSAALGFVAAEAATLWGGAFLWVRTPAWRPRFAEVDGVQVDYAWLDEEQVPEQG
ncbi:MAG: flippase-like domain-containing protein [Deltaproteobacteria bacterium]|nr:flippase-like domain-containing protein [Deltaproteobacteria bacterium]